MRPSYAVAALADIPPLRIWEGVVRHAVRDHFEIGSFGVNVYVAPKAGLHVIEQHDHGSGLGGAQEELYLILSGRASFEIDGERVDVPSGSMVWVDPGAKRVALAREPGTAVFVVGAPRGAPYDPPPWPAAAGMWRYRELLAEGDLDAACGYLDDVVERFPGSGGIFYQRALCQCLRQRPADALDDLGRAVALDARLADLARRDEGFALLRDSPGFERLVGRS